MFIKDGVYREIDVKVDAPIAEGTILTFGGTLAAEDASDAFGIVPENIYVLPPTKKTRVVIGGTIDLDDPANKGVTFSDAVVKALGMDINFVPAAEAGGGGLGAITVNARAFGSGSHMFGMLAYARYDGTKWLAELDNALCNVYFLGDAAYISTPAYPLPTEENIKLFLVVYRPTLDGITVTLSGDISQEPITVYTDGGTYGQSGYEITGIAHIDLDNG